MQGACKPLGCGGAIKCPSGASCCAGFCSPPSSQACNDGNAVAGDGCNLSCKVEPGWTCSGSPSVCTAICGDGLRLGAEGCDDGNTTDGDGCSSTCTIEPNWTCTTSAGIRSACSGICGDGIIVAPGECEDGNMVNGDGCSSTCAVELGWECVAAIPETCQKNTFTSEPDGAQVQYALSGTGLLAPTSGTFPLLATSSTILNATDGCSALTVDLTGGIALIARGGCAFVQKVVNAQNAGAVAVVVYNNQGDSLVAMSLTAPPQPITIPAVFIGGSSGQTLAALLHQGSATLTWTPRLTQ